MKNYVAPKLEELVFSKADVLLQSTSETFGGDPYEWVNGLIGGGNND